jgi:hypothetical protein
MATHQITANGILYTVIDDVFFDYAVIVSGAVRDATSGSLLGTVPAVSVDLAGITGRFTAGYYAGAATIPLVFPKLATQAYSFNIAFRATGYRNKFLAVAVPMNAVFPLSPGDANLVPLPVRLQGRVVRNTVARPPVPGALIASTDLKHPLLRTGLESAHAAGETVQQLVLTPAGPVRHLTLPAVAGDSVIQLDNMAGLVPGSVLKIGPDERDDYAIVSAVGAMVVLRLPLVRSGAAGAVVQEQTPGAPAVTTTLAASTEAGDGALSLAGNLATADPVSVGAGPALEYRTLGALTDADGYYGLDGLTGFQTVAIAASKALFPTQNVNWMPVYGLDPNVLNFRL